MRFGKLKVILVLGLLSTSACCPNAKASRLSLSPAGSDMLEEMHLKLSGFTTTPPAVSNSAKSE
jgi:hypothetical protein